MDKQTECGLATQYVIQFSDKRNKGSLHATAWLNHENTLSEKSQIQKEYCVSLYEKTRIGKSTEGRGNWDDC